MKSSIMRNDKRNLIADMSLQFALNIIEYAYFLKEEKHYELAF